MSSDIRPRGAGKTTAAILAAPVGAIYLCPCRASCEHTKALALHLGRADLRVMSPSDLVERLGLSHRRGTPVLRDHALNFMALSNFERQAVWILESRQ